MEQSASIGLQTQLFALTGIAALASVKAIDLSSEYVAKLHLLLAIQTEGSNSELQACPEDIIDLYFNELVSKEKKDENRNIQAS